MKARPDAPFDAGIDEGRYVVQGGLGAGTGGRVVEAFDTLERRRVAVKRVRRLDFEGVFRLKQEFRALRTLSHPNVVDPYELFFDHDDLCYSMEFVDGIPLPLYCQRVRLDPTRVRGVMRQLLSAMEAIHAHGIVHRDLKPSNILVTDAGRLVLLDFGLTKQAFGERLGITEESSWVGTPLYMAPEQFCGKAGPASDRYAFGAILYECLIGDLPFPHGNIYELIDAKRRGLVDQNPRLGGFDALLRGLLDPDPDRRPNAAALRAHFGGEAPGPTAVPVGCSFAGYPLLDANVRRFLKGAPRTATRFQCWHADRADAGLSWSVEVARRLRSSFPSTCVAVGRRSPQERIPLGVFDHLLDDIAAHSRCAPAIDTAVRRCGRETCAILEASFPAAGVLFEVHHRRLRRLEKAWVRTGHALIEAAAEFLGHIAAAQPLLLVFDDSTALSDDERGAVQELVHLLRREPVMFLFGSALDSGRPQDSTSSGDSIPTASIRRISNDWRL